MQKESEENRVNVQALNAKLEEISTTENMFIDELRAKNELIESLKEEKLNVGMSFTRVKGEYLM